MAGWLRDPVLNVALSSGLGIPLSDHFVRQAIARFAEDSTTRVDFCVLALGGPPIGWVHLAEIDPWARHAELGIFIGEADYRGRGFGTETTRLVVEFGFNQLNLNKVWLTVDADNEAALRCYNRVGFRRDGVIRDAVYRDGRYIDRILMSVLRSEYTR